MRLEEEIGERLTALKMTVSTAESCTGGGIAARLTSVPGSSAYMKGGIVAYCNEVKISMLGVDSDTLERVGAVSRETVEQMARGAMERLKTECALATSGIAGPGGGTADKPAGTIWIALAYKNEIHTQKLEGDFGREQNVQRTIEMALKMLCERLKG